MEQLASVLERSSRPARPRLSVAIAEFTEVIRAAQELRYRVFAEEMGAKLSSSYPEKAGKL